MRLSSIFRPSLFLHLLLLSTSIFLFACAPHADIAQNENSSKEALSPLHDVEELLESGRKSKDEGDWLAAQQSFDLAASELLEVEGSSKNIKNERKRLMMEILHELEQVYPHLAKLGEIDTLFDFQGEESFKPDSSQTRLLHSFLDTLNLSSFSLPVVLNERVLDEIEYLTSGARRFTENTLGRMGAFQEQFRAKLREKGMPEDLVFMSFVESGFKRRAYSRAGASGLWQFIASTGRRYGLKVDWWVDLRRNPDMATDAAISYLSDLYNEFHDWWLVMAAYNAGEGRIRRLIASEKNRNYWDLPLPKETMHYVPRILAAMIIGRHPEQYGFNYTALPPWKKDTLTVEYCIPLADLAKKAHFSLDTLRDYNIELKRWCTPPGIKKYVLNLPVGTREQFYKAYSEMDKTELTGWFRHKVAWGENLGGISNQYGVPIVAIKSANNMKSNRLRAGQILMVPLPAGAKAPAQPKFSKSLPPKKQTLRTYKVVRGDNLFDLSRRFGVSMDELIKQNHLKSGAKLSIGQKLVIGASNKLVGNTYTVQSGDTYYSLSLKTGASVEELMRLNATKSSSLSVGQKILIPKVTKNSTSEKSGNHQDRHEIKPNVSGAILSTYTVRDGDSPYSISLNQNVSLSDLLSWNGMDENSRIFPGQKLKIWKIPSTQIEKSKKKKSAKTSLKKEDREVIWYTVKSGDTLWDLSRRFGVSVDTLKSWNDLKNRGMIPGRRLVVGKF